MSPLVVLNSYYLRKKSAGYSLRALARDLDRSPAFISNILKGKKKIPRALLTELSRRLDIDPETALEIKRQLFPEHGLVTGLFKNPRAAQTWEVENKKSLSALRQWFYIAILEILTCSTFDGSKEFISSRLGISMPSVEIALRELTGLGLITLENSRIVKTKKKIKLSASKSVHEIRNFHRQMLQKAEAELDSTSNEAFEKRLITGIMISADPERIQIAKKMLSDALHDIANYLTAESGSEVYHLAAQLFPVTKP